jgi:plastocyanin
MRRLTLAAAGLLVALTLAACSSASGAPNPSAIPSQPPASVDPDAVVVSAHGIAFDQSQVTVSAGKAFTLTFDNSGDSAPHNVAIEDAGGANVFRGDIIDGGKTTAYAVPALAAGTYTFKCDVHSGMKGTVVAQ